MRKLGALISVPTKIVSELEQYDKDILLQHVLQDDIFAVNVKDFIEIQSATLEEVCILNNEKECMTFMSTLTCDPMEQKRIEYFMRRTFTDNCALIYCS